MDENTRKIREAIDCCRPGSDDLRAPELALLVDAVDTDDELRADFERSQQLDTHIRGVYQDVPVPEGLEERLLARLAWDGDRPAELGCETGGMGKIVEAATEAADASSTNDKVSTPAVGSPEEPRHSARPWRYAIYWGAPAVALIAAVVGMLVGLRQDTTEISRDEFLRWSDAAVSASLEDGSWNHDLAGIPSDREFPSQTVEGEPRAWLAVPLAEIDDRAVAHLLNAQVDSEVVLLVADCRRKVVGLKPEPSKLPASGQQSVGAWQVDGQVFVLVVRGRGHARRYQSLLRTRGQMANLPRKVSPVCLIGKV